jgi:phosphate starvation-inducible PhoH-like protein
MTRKKRSDQSSIGIGLTTRQTKRRKPIGREHLLEIDPLTENQRLLYQHYDEGKHLFAHGVPGSGKTFILLYKALKEVLDERSPYDRVLIMRSAVATREIGYLPGSLEEKIGNFEIPYKGMVKYMFQMPGEIDFEMLYGNLKAQNTIAFDCTSFLRGTTIDNTIIIVDEAQNLSAHECFSVITRCGEDTKIMFSGDIEQSDFTKISERNGILDFIRIIDIMPSFKKIEFGVDDIVRSPLVKEFVIAKKSLGL